LLWRFRNYEKIDPQKGVDIDLGEIEPRLRQVSTGFASMLADKPEELKIFKEYLIKYQQELREERAGTVEGRIINAIAELFDLGNEQITAGSIILKADLQTRRNEPWHPRALTSYMKSLGFGTATAARIGGSMGKYYSFTRKQLIPLLQRFGDDKEFIDKFCYHVTEETDIVEGPHFFKNTLKGSKNRGDPPSINGNTVTTVTTVTDDLEVLTPCEHGQYVDEECIFCQQEAEKERAKEK